MQPLDLDLTIWKKKLRLKKEEDQTYIFDPIRNKWLVLQPEEVVRQLMVQYLIEVKGYSRNRLYVEQGLEVNTLLKRSDILVYDGDGRPFIMVECKSPKVAITNEVLHQITNYNLPLQVPFLIVTNGPCTCCCKIDHAGAKYEFLEAIPENRPN
ncbi:MAG: type I restriction enzyme HsdR N-terminal domain-containing protein [Saprospiraceae bacterium]